MYFLPTRLLQVNVTAVDALEYWSDYSNPTDPWIGYPNKFTVSMNVMAQAHSSADTRFPYFYDGEDIKVGDWIGSSANGIALRITAIVSQTSSNVVVEAEDVDRFNTINDPFQAGNGGVAFGTGYVFTVDQNGMPNINGVVPGSLPHTFVDDLQARFSRYNDVNSFVRIKQAGHTFVKGDVLYMDADGDYKLLPADSTNKDKLGRVVGTVSEANIPSPDYFMIKPRGSFERDIDPPLPAADPGSLIYIDPANPGKLTAEKPARFAVPVYIRLHDDTTGIFLTGGTGTGAAGPLGYYETAYVVADLAARDALDKEQLELGDTAYVKANADGKWEFYKVIEKTVVANVADVTWQMVSGEELFAATKSRINNIANTTSVDTEVPGKDGKIVMTSNEKTVVEVESSPISLDGEKLLITTDLKEVQFVAQDTDGTDNVDIRMVPQAQGHVYFGTYGNGIVESELTFDLLVKAGNNDEENTPGNLTITGGNAVSGDFNGGDVTIRAGVGFGTGVPGAISVEDGYGTKIVDFKTAGATSSNWLEIRNGSADPDEAINAVKLSVSEESSAASVDLLLDPKGDGLVRVADYTTYETALEFPGNIDALATKGYVLTLAGLLEPEPTITAGPGLIETDHEFSVSVGADTIGLDGVGNVIVTGTTSAGEVLLSKGIAGEEALWGKLNLSSAASFTGILPVAMGGTGLGSFAQGDLLVGNTTNGIEKLTLGVAGQSLVSDGTTLDYVFADKLYDADGNTTFATAGVTDAVNHVSVQNSVAATPVEIQAVGDDTNIDIRFVPAGAGQLVAKNGYTASIGTNPETLVTKKFVEDAIKAQDEPYMRRVTLTSGWASDMNIGAILPNLPGKSVYIYRAMVKVNNVIVGGGAVQARITSGANVVMEFNENDILETGTYIADLSESFTSNSAQLKIEFYQSDNTSLATPTSGNIEVSVYYRIR